MEHNLNQTHAPLAPYSKDHESGREFSRLALASIAIDGGTQSRAHLDQGTIDDYAEAMAEGATFPAVIVYHDGERHWLADGFHRYHATRKAELPDIAAEVRQGTRRDAVLHSVGANAEHGLRRSNEDKRRAVRALLSDAEWSQWSDREIARRCRVSQPFVGKCRVAAGVTDSVISERWYPTRHGTTATMQTGNIGSTKAPARTITRTIDREFQNDPAFQATADESARDIEIERDERIAMAGDPAAELAAENESLRHQVKRLDRRVAALTEETGSLKARVEVWKDRAIKAGWTKVGANA